MTSSSSLFAQSDESIPSGTINYDRLRRRAAKIFALPPDAEVWTEDQRTEIDDVIHEGLLMVYTPPADQIGAHSWSFMNPTFEIETAADQQWYLLPQGFDHMDDDGLFTYTNENEYYTPVLRVSESWIRKMDYQIDYTSFPTVFAIRPKDSDGTTAQRWEVGFHPVPNAVYRLSARYHAIPHTISDENPYPLGSPSHGLLFLLAVEAAASKYEEIPEAAMYQDRFVTQLRAEVLKDARRGPRFLGYNGNGGIFQRRSRASFRRAKQIFSQNVTYNP